MTKSPTIPPLATDPVRLLGGLTPETFLREYWHKKALLVRQAVPGISAALSLQGLAEMACGEDSECRLVFNNRGRWRLEHGPFSAERLERLPERGWSLLVSGVNYQLAEGDALLHGFSFVPQARLDDLMVSYAPLGGGVGPHFDSYDVFLIQGLGKRRWEISAQDDLELVEGSPLRILKHFRPDQSWVLEPGDLLYLPPRYAHNGVALSECMTWSVGFRAPSHQEIGLAFLTHLQDRLDLDGRYADPDLKPPRHTAQLPGMMVERLNRVIKAIRWNKEDVEEFLGVYLSEPKPNVYFHPPKRPLTPARFLDLAGKRGIRLDPCSRMLFAKTRFFINGEPFLPPAFVRRSLVDLADRRGLDAGEVSEPLMPWLYEWYRSGYLHLA